MHDKALKRAKSLAIWELRKARPARGCYDRMVLTAVAFCGIEKFSLDEFAGCAVFWTPPMRPRETAAKTRVTNAFAGPYGPGRKR